MDDIKHRAGIAAVLSFLFNGLGQLYVGEIAKGLKVMVVSAVSMVFITVGGIFSCHWLLYKAYSIVQLALGIGLLFMGIIIACLMGIYSITEAYKKALE